MIGSSSRKVVRIETAATSMGRNASKDAKTNSKTARAPSPPSKVSASTLLPPDSSPTARASMPVTPTVAPSGACALTALRTTSVGRTLAKLSGKGSKTIAYAVRSSSVRKAASPVLASSSTRSGTSACVTDANAAPICFSLPVTVLPSGIVTVTSNGTVLPPLP